MIRNSAAITLGGVLIAFALLVAYGQQNLNGKVHAGQKFPDSIGMPATPREFSAVEQASLRSSTGYGDGIGTVSTGYSCRGPLDCEHPESSTCDAGLCVAHPKTK